MVTGQNGILSRAKEAKEITEYKSAEEKVKLAVSGAMSDDGILTIDKLKIELGEDKISGDKFPVIVTEDGKRYEVNAKGNVIEEGKINAMSVATSTQEELQSIYGASVSNYEPVTTTDVGWKIFYSDGNSIYLIADNYIEPDNFPESTNAAGAKTGRKPKGKILLKRDAIFNNILSDYSTGSSRITDSKLRNLNNNYFNDKKYTSIDNNMKAVAYILDTVAWNSKFKDINNKADYVIGGPTVEMLFNSYNSKHGTNYIAEATSAIGYKLKATSTDSSWNTSLGRDTLDNKDSLYVVTGVLGEEETYGMWLGSPAGYTGEILHASYVGAVFGIGYDQSSIGFRPVVCLNSDVILKRNVDNTYTIQ